MNKQNNRLALSVVATLTAAIALIYTLIQFHHIIFAVAGMSIIFLITAYILTQNIIAFVNIQNKSQNVQIKACMDDISSQLEAMNGAQSQLGKANYLYTRRIAQAITTLEANYNENQKTLYENLHALSNSQNKATKLMIKYDQSNTTKVISTLKELRNQLSETMIQGFDQIQPNNTEMVSALEDIVSYLKTQPGAMDQAMGLQLNNVAHELQNISNSIQRVQFPLQGMAAQVSYQESAPQPTQSAVQDSPTDTIEPATVAPEQPYEEPVDTTLTSNLANELTTNDILNDDTLDELTTDSILQNAITETAELEAVATPADVVAEQTIENTENEATDIVNTENEDTDSTDTEIAEPFTPTFTVVGKSEPEEEPADEELPLEDSPVLGDDPNKQLSPEEIAALFAAAEPAPKKEEAPAEPVAATPVADDPNKQLSPDEIAALFAAAEPAPKKESDEEQMMDEAIAAAAEPVTVTPISDDPNKQLSPEEIAALFASLG